MSARERFVATRKAVTELDTIKALIMTRGDDWKPEGVKQPGNSDPTAARAIYNVDEWGEQLVELRRQERELESFIGVTLGLIEAVRDGLGDEYADILDQRYIDCLPWKFVVVDGEVVPRSTGKLKVSIAFDWIDSVGMSRLLKGDVEV